MVILLLKVKFLSPTTVFTICTIAQGVALACYYFFYSTLKSVNIANNVSREDKMSDLDQLLEKDETV